MLAGTRQGFVPGLLLRLIVLITVIMLPVALLLAVQVRFLPYHEVSMTWWHRSVLLADLVLLWALWSVIVLPQGTFAASIGVLLTAPIRFTRAVLRKARAHGTELMGRILNGPERTRARCASGSAGVLVVSDHATRPFAGVVTVVGLFALTLVAGGASLLLATIPGEAIERRLAAQNWLERIGEGEHRSVAWRTPLSDELATGFQAVVLAPARDMAAGGRP